MSHFNVGQPFSNNIQECRIQANDCADNSDNNPALCSIVRLQEAVSPCSLSLFVEARGSSCFGLASCMFSRGILYPVYRREVLVSFDFSYFLLDLRLHWSSIGSALAELDIGDGKRQPGRY